MNLLSFLTIFYFSSGVFSLSLFSPCKNGDVECIEKSGNAAISQICAGNTELGIEEACPLFLEEIIGDLKVLKYIFHNSTFTGGQNTVLTNLLLDKDYTNAKFDLIFNDIELFGKYEINGKLFDLAIDGSGDYSFIADKYNISVDLQLEKVKGEKGKTHIFIKSFKLKCTPITPITFNFKNLFSEKKELADTIHKFANENWMKVALLVQDPGWNAAMDKLFHIVNQYLKNIAIEDFIIN